MIDVIEISVYLAGPLYSSGDLVTNNRMAIDACAALETASIPGVVLRPFIPHVNTLTWQLVHPRTHETGQAWDDYWLRKCDLLLRLPGASVGGDHEVGLMQSLGRPVYYNVNDVIAYARLLAA